MADWTGKTTRTARAEAEQDEREREAAEAYLRHTEWLAIREANGRGIDATTKAARQEAQARLLQPPKVRK